MKTSFLTAAGLMVVIALGGGVARGQASSASEGKPTVASPVVMTEELMQRLIKFARSQKEPGSVTGKIALIFNLSDGTKDLPLQLIETERPEGTYLGVPLNRDSGDVLIMQKRDGNVEAYLTDKTGKLRAAAIADGKPAAHLLINEKAAAKYEAALNALAREAAEDLPPSEGSAPDKK